MTTRRTRPVTALALGATLLSVVARAQVIEDRDPSSPEARQALRRAAQPLFDEASREFGVPGDLLRAYAFVHTRWSVTQHAERAPDHMPPIFGIMGLHDGRDGWFRDQVGRAADLLGVPAEDVREDTATNIRGAAALLRAEADALGARGDAVEAWAPAVERMTAIPPGDAVDRFARKSEVYDVLATLARGHATDGIRIPARPVRLDRAFSPADLKVLRAPLVDAQSLDPAGAAPAAPAAPAAAPPDDPSALWNPTTCFSSRNGTRSLT